MTTTPWFDDRWIGWASAGGRLTGDVRRQLAECEFCRCASAEYLPTDGSRKIAWLNDAEVVVFNDGGVWTRLDTLEPVV
jgi:hypothetical protein